MQKSSTPLWETLVMVGSFVLLWAWFLAFKSAERSNVPLPILWHVALLVALGALVLVTVRRVQRLGRALRGEDEDGTMAPMYPMFGDPPNKKR
jgi:hypothetical protein